MLIFPDTENTGNCKTIARSFQHGDNFDILNIKGCNRIVVQPFGFCSNFELGISRLPLHTFPISTIKCKILVWRDPEYFGIL